MKAALVTWSSTRFDSRVQRCTKALLDAGHSVVLISPDCPVDLAGKVQHQPVPAFGTTRADMMVNALVMAPANLAPRLATTLHRLHPCHRATVVALEKSGADVIHANDWMTLPAAVHFARKTRARVLYDSHEMATEEHATRPLWRLLFGAHIAAVEGRFIGQADAVMTVGDGLANALSRRYPTLPRLPHIVRNMPDMAAQPRSDLSGAGRRLVYAGLIRPERQIDAMIEALARLDDRFTLTVIGFGPSDYIASLKARAAKLGVANRVIWRAPVPPDQLVQTLSAFDIGLFLMEGATAQQRYALPNKIFEYTAAGLAIVASGSEDVAGLLAENGHGMCPSDCSAEALFGSLSLLTDEQLAAFQTASGLLSKAWTWNQEKQRFLALFASFEFKI